MMKGGSATVAALAGLPVNPDTLEPISRAEDLLNIRLVASLLKGATIETGPQLLHLVAKSFTVSVDTTGCSILCRDTVGIENTQDHRTIHTGEETLRDQLLRFLTGVEIFRGFPPNIGRSFDTTPSHTIDECLAMTGAPEADIKAWKTCVDEWNVHVVAYVAARVVEALRPSLIPNGMLGETSHTRM